MDDYKYHPRGGVRGDGTPPFRVWGAGGGGFLPCPPRLLRLCPPPYFFYTPKFLGPGKRVGEGGGQMPTGPVASTRGGHVKNYHFIFHKLLWQQI